MTGRFQSLTRSSPYLYNVTHNVRIYLFEIFDLILIFIKTYLTKIMHQPGAVLDEVLPYTTQFINIDTIVQHKT